MMGLGLFFGDLDDPDNEDAGDDDVNDSVLNVLLCWWKGDVQLYNCCDWSSPVWKSEWI